MLGTTARAGSSALPPLPRFPMSKVADNMERPLVLIVDDDEEIRSALEELLLSVGISGFWRGLDNPLPDPLPRGEREGLESIHTRKRRTSPLRTSAWLRSVSIASSS